MHIVEPSRKPEQEVGGFPFEGWLAIGAFSAAFLVLAILSLHEVIWVGHTVLQIEFVVTDAATGKPIPDASIVVHSAEDLPPARRPADITLIVDANGRIVHDAGNRTCGGHDCFWRSTYFVYRPEWEARATAEGYAPSSVQQLWKPEFAPGTERTGPSKSRMIVPIVLEREARD